MTTTSSPLGNQSLARALVILELLANARGEVGVRDIARSTGMAASVVQRLVNTLAASGFVERSAHTQRYRIGYKAFQVGSAYVAGTGLAEVAIPELNALSEKHKVNTYLGVLREHHVIYLACIRSSSPVVINSAPGSQAFVHATAFGKALLSDATDEQIAEVLGPEPYPRITPKTRTTLAEVIADVREGTQHGYFVSDGENLGNVLAVGAPVRDASGRVVAAISAASPRSEIRKTEFAALRVATRDSANLISCRLGAPPR